MRHFMRYFLICLVSLWILGFWYVFYGGRKNSTSSRSSNDYEAANAAGNGGVGDVYHDGEAGYSKKDLVKRLRKAERLLVQLEEENKKNEALIKELKQNSMRHVNNQIVQPSVSNRPSNELDGKFPGESFESQRRQIFHNIKDLSYYLNSEINTVLTNKGVDIDTNKRLNRIKNSAQHRTNALIAQMYNMSIDGALGEWRVKVADKMRDRVLQDLKKLQNPSDCKQARKVVCDLNKACGFGCQMHHVMYCFISSFFLNRTLILESSGWRYNSAGYGAYFLPVSDTCTSLSSNEKVVGWNDASSESAQVIKIPIIDVLANRPKFLPLTVPKRYASELKSFHGDPFAWWAGEILNYLMRFNSDFTKVIKQKRTDLGFANPCVGVHVRRTDKLIAEASYHSIDEYMRYVEEYFDILDLRTGVKGQRTVFLATDEFAVLQEAQKKYPSYKFIYDEANARSAAMAERYSPQSAQGVILDIHFLSQCDYLVCTLSSQVCRMAYELMQARYADASWRFKSLDDVYYFGGQHGHRMRAVLAHGEADRQRGEITLAVGDIVGLAGDHWNGFSKVKNFRTNEEGLVPSYKLVEIVEEF